MALMTYKIKDGPQWGYPVSLNMRTIQAIDRQGAESNLRKTKNDPFDLRLGHTVKDLGNNRRYLRL